MALANVRCEMESHSPLACETEQEEPEHGWASENVVSKRSAFVVAFGSAVTLVILGSALRFQHSGNKVSMLSSSQQSGLVTLDAKSEVARVASEYAVTVVNDNVFAGATAAGSFDVVNELDSQIDV